MGKLTKADYLYGSRSAIRVAIRRGDLALAYSAFDMLWSVPEHRNWFKLRLPLIMVEEAFYLSGVFAHFMRKERSTADEKQGYKTFLGVLTLVKKSKDAHALSKLALVEKKDDEWKYRELVSVRKLWRLSLETGVARAGEKLLDAGHDNKMSSYCLNALKTLHENILKGGRQGNLATILTGMFMIIIRGLDKKEVDDEVRPILTLLSVDEKTVPLPWYVFHPNLHVGREACETLLTKFSVSMDRLKGLWFYHEIEKIDNKYINHKILNEEKGTSLESRWWNYERARSKINSKEPWTLFQIDAKTCVEGLIKPFQPHADKKDTSKKTRRNKGAKKAKV